MPLELAEVCALREQLDRIKDIVGVKTNKARDLIEDIGDLVCMRDGCEKTDPETGEPTGVMFLSYNELRARLDFQSRYAKEGEKEWKDEINQHNETKKENENLKAEIKKLKAEEATKDYKLTNGIVIQATQSEIDICEIYEKKLDARFEEDCGDQATDEDEIEDNDPEEYGEYLNHPQPLDSGWAEIMGYDDQTKGLFKIFNEFKPPVVEHPEELKEDYEKAGQAIGNCLKATTTFAWFIAQKPDYINEVKVMCFAHKYGKLNPQSPDNNTRIHWVLLYKDFVVDCFNGQSRGIWKSKEYFSYLPELLGSHTCKLMVYLANTFQDINQPPLS